MLNAYTLKEEQGPYYTTTMAIAIQKSNHEEWVRKQDRKEARKAAFKRFFRGASKAQ